MQEYKIDGHAYIRVVITTEIEGQFSSLIQQIGAPQIAV